MPAREGRRTMMAPVIIQEIIYDAGAILSALEKENESQAMQRLSLALSSTHVDQMRVQPRINISLHTLYGTNE